VCYDKAWGRIRAEVKQIRISSLRSDDTLIEPMKRPPRRTDQDIKNECVLIDVSSYQFLTETGGKGD